MRLTVALSFHISIYLDKLDVADCHDEGMIAIENFTKFYPHYDETMFTFATEEWSQIICLKQTNHDMLFKNYAHMGMHAHDQLICKEDFTFKL